MPPVRVRQPFVILVSIVASAGAATAQLHPLPLTPTHPVALEGTRPGGLELVVATVPAVAATLAYGNTFRMSDAVHRAHLEIDGRGSPLSDAAVRQAVIASGKAWAFDTEVLRCDLEAVAPLGGRWFVGGRLSAWTIGGTGLDGVARAWHDVIGVHDARDRYPDGETVARLATGRYDASLAAESGWTVGRVTAWTGVALATADQPIGNRLWLTAAVPTSSRIGRSGVDLGLRWMGVREIGPFRLFGGAGTTRLAPGDWPAAREHRWAWHGWAGLDWSLTPRWGAGLWARLDSSALDSSIEGRPAADSAELAVGLRWAAGPATELAVALGEDFPGMGLAPDFSLQVRLLWRPSAARHRSQP